MSNFENKYVSFSELNELNEESIGLGYNRNLYFERVSEDLMEKCAVLTKVMLEPVMIHSHKGGVPCEDHLRCIVHTSGFLSAPLTLDVSIKSFKKISDVSVKEVA